jgi:predicted HNH restriction endonuclease
MNNIREVLKIINSVNKYNKIINEFAINQYNDKFGDTKNQKDSFHFYDGYEVVSDTKLLIKYKYGIGDMEYNDSFLIEI